MISAAQPARSLPQTRHKGLTLNRFITINGVARDVQAALGLFVKACDMGEANACSAAEALDP